MKVSELRSCLEEKFGHFRLPTNKPDTVRKQVDDLEQLERPEKKSRGQRLKGVGETGGLVHSLVMKRIMIKVSQGLIMSQINVAKFGSAVKHTQNSIFLYQKQRKRF